MCTQHVLPEECCVDDWFECLQDVFVDGVSTFIVARTRSSIIHLLVVGFDHVSLCWRDAQGFP